MVEASEVVREFINKGMHITPEALDVIRDSSDSDVRQVLSDLEQREDRPSIVTGEIVSHILESEETIPSSPPSAKPEEETESESEATSEGPESDSSDMEIEEKCARESGGEESTGSIDVREEEVFEEEELIENRLDITGESTSEGEVEDFVQLFRDRYEKLSSVIRSREGFQNHIELENVVRYEGSDVCLVGLVNEKRETRKKDAWIVELEDPSGRAVVYVKDSERNEKVVDKIKKVVTDEVIGVKARVPDELRSGNRNPLVWGNDIVWPDIPITETSSSENESMNATGHAVLISDLHVGSEMFMSNVFDKFLDWINGTAGNDRQKKLAEDVKYLIIAGDLVDGIGIYPGQQEELKIESIRDQYKKVAELLSRVPDDITIIAAPGNHDAIRLAEPQPALHTEVASPLRELNIKLVGNPAFLSIEGVKFLIYHGMGFEDLISAVSELDRNNETKPMEEMLKRRHLAPIYGEPMGGRTPIAPEEEDYLAISEVPDVLHCGHIHRYGCAEYRGVLMINSATFQKQTSFMKRQGVVPTPGHVPIVNLENKNAKAINFA